MKMMQKSLMVLAALALAGCADMQPRPNSLAPGTTWVNQVRSTGSFGNVNEQRRTRVAGERMWQGRKVFAYENVTAGVGTVTDPDTGRWIALVRGDAPVFTWDPPIGWERPLEVGKTWSRNHKVTVHANKTTIDFTGNWKVEALEDVTVPAGTFKAYKVVYSDTLGNEDVTWWCPEADVFVKVSNRRTAKHRSGPGTNDIELVQRPTAP